MAFELSGETKNKPCSCGCGTKADVAIIIGKQEVPITNDCMYKMVLELFSLTENIKKNQIKTKLGSFKDSYGILTDYGIADEKHDDALIFYNEETKKGIKIEWNELYSFVKHTGINEY
ncbi:MAG: hypothetical protein FWE03_02370 [Firmicutes bacterium]|nr:hypothetical protein [Bacillota bacterium]